MRVYLIFLLFVICYGSERILKTELYELMFIEGRYTSSIIKPKLQMICPGDFCHYQPTHIICTRDAKYHREFLAWGCVAKNMPLGFEVQNYDIECVGFEHENDPYIEIGSCSVYFDVIKTRNKFPRPTINYESFNAITSLTFYNNRNTSYRNIEAYPQMSCRQNLCEYSPSSISCNKENDNFKCSSTNLKKGYIIQDNFEIKCEYLDLPHYTNKQIVSNSCRILFDMMSDPNYIPQQSFLFKEGAMITFYPNRMKCIGEFCGTLPLHIDCLHKGFNSMNQIIWDCTAPLSREYIFDIITIDCSDNHDSCYITYKLKRNPNYINPKKILLSSINYLDFYKDRFSITKSGDKKPQMICINDCPIQLSHITCNNMGYSNWYCTSPNIPDGFRLHDAIVKCEGYDSLYDKYISENSCVVEYLVKSSNMINKISLYDKKSLTFTRDGLTRGRQPLRSHMICTGSNCNHAPYSIICYYKNGFDCHGTHLEPNYELINTKIICDQYDNIPHHIIEGSCYLEYSLKYNNPTNLSDFLICLFVIGLVCIVILILVVPNKTNYYLYDPYRYYGHIWPHRTYNRKSPYNWYNPFNWVHQYYYGFPTKNNSYKMVNKVTPSSPTNNITAKVTANIRFREKSY